MTVTWPTGIGAIIALCVLIITIIVLAFLPGQIDLKVGVLIIALAVARLT
jgi:hypothetical protein